jgi:hypothetical protein
MKHLLVAALLLAAAVGGTAHADEPYRVQGEPDLGLRPPCTAAYVRSLERQAAALQHLRQTGPEAMDRLCSLIELGSALLGLDADVRRVTRECRIGQGNLERELIGRLGWLRSELVRCNDTI